MLTFPYLNHLDSDICSSNSETKNKISKRQNKVTVR